MTKEEIQEIVQESSRDTVIRMREFHLDDMKVMREHFDMRFEAMARRFDGVDERLDKFEVRMDRMEGKIGSIENRLDHIESALATILNDIHDQRARIEFLEQENKSLQEQIRVLTLQVHAQYQTA